MTGFLIDISGTTIDPSLTLTITLQACVFNGGTNIQCEQTLETTIVSTAICPSVTITPYIEAIEYTYLSAVGYTYRTQLYYAGAVTPIQIITDLAPGANVAGTFTGLVKNTNYELEVVLIDGVGNETSCPRVPV